jgi:hypothetical protein
MLPSDVRFTVPFSQMVRGRREFSGLRQMISKVAPVGLSMQTVMGPLIFIRIALLLLAPTSLVDVQK